jgi:hypothetical protein
MRGGPVSSGSVRQGFEDCYVFDRLLDKHNNNFGNSPQQRPAPQLAPWRRIAHAAATAVGGYTEAAAREYSTSRVADVQAIADLALYNYVEVR